MIAAGIDAGTQSIKVIVYDSVSHEIIASSAEPLELIVGEGGVKVFFVVEQVVVGPVV